MQNLDGLFNTLVFWDSCGINGIYSINTMYIYNILCNQINQTSKRPGRVSQIDHGSVHFGVRLRGRLGRASAFGDPYRL